MNWHIMPVVNRNSTMSYATQSHLYVLSLGHRHKIDTTCFDIPNVSWCRVTYDALSYIIEDVLVIERPPELIAKIPLARLPSDLKDLCAYWLKCSRQGEITIHIVALTWHNEAVDMKITTTQRDTTSMDVIHRATYPCVSMSLFERRCVMLLQPNGTVQSVSRGKTMVKLIDLGDRLDVNSQNSRLSGCCVSYNQYVATVWDKRVAVDINSMHPNENSIYDSGDSSIKYRQSLNNYRLTLHYDGTLLEQRYSFLPHRQLDKCCRIATIYNTSNTMMWLCIREDNTAFVVGNLIGRGFDESDYMLEEYTVPNGEIVVTDTDYIKPRVQVKSARKA